MNNVGAQLRLPKEDIEGLKLCATGGKRCFDCDVDNHGNDDECVSASEIIWLLTAQ